MDFTLKIDLYVLRFLLYTNSMSYRGFDDLIPPRVIDEIVNGGDHPSSCAFRALKRSNEKTIKDDFLPSFEDSTQQCDFIPPELRNYWLPNCVVKGQSSYGMSLFNNLDQLKITVHKISSMRKHVIGFAQGITDSAKGIAGLPDDDTHFEYFLYNSMENNPCIDFAVVEKRDPAKDDGK